MGERELDDWLSGYMAFTEQTEPPVLYRKWVAISTVAACLQRKCYVQWHKIIYPNQYIVLVGSSGKCRKTEAMYPSEAMLKKLGIKMTANSVTREALVRQLKDSKTLALNAEDQLMAQHCSLTVFSKELTVFLGHNNPDLMAWLVDWYDCDDDWTYETKNKGTDHVRGVYVNLIGATTPRLIQSAMPKDAIGGGLTSRIMFVFEAQKGKRVHYPIPSQATKELGGRVLNDLERIYALQGQFKLSEGFMEFWGPWYDKNEDQPPFTDESLDGYLSRRPTHLFKISMALSACRSDEMVIRRKDSERALALMVDTERKMQHTFRGMGKSKYADVLVAIQVVLAKAGKMDVAELLDRFSSDVMKKELLEILYTLEAMKKVKIDTTGERLVVRYLGDKTDV